MKNIESLSIVVQWDVVDDFLFTTYAVTWGDRIDQLATVTVDDQTSYTITGLTLDTVYTITVTAANRCGQGPEFRTSVSFSTDTTSTASTISPTVTASTNPMTIISTVNPSSTTTTADTSSTTTTTTTSATVMNPSTTTTNLMTTTVGTHTSAMVTTTNIIRHMTTTTSVINLSTTTAPAATVSSSTFVGITATSRYLSTTTTTTSTTTIATTTTTNVVMSSTPATNFTNPDDVTSKFSYLTFSVITCTVDPKFNISDRAISTKLFKHILMNEDLKCIHSFKSP